MEKIRTILYGVADYARRLAGTKDVASVAFRCLMPVLHGGDCILTEER